MHVFEGTWRGVVNTAYRVAALFCHPDKAEPQIREMMTAVFQRLVAAREMLMNDPLYDMLLHYHKRQK